MSGGWCAGARGWHDDFMLPHYVEQDFRDVLAELDSLGCPIDPEWFGPHQEFRFPLIGEVNIGEAELELRHALEPWHVMGEEPGGGGAVRYVDSSVERVQAKVTGWVEERYQLACNGVAVPLTPTERQGEHVAGVRFKAWQPPVSALHPTIPAQTPLVVDIYDRWTGRSLGGLTHHVAHPGGRHYERFPVNANEAEARRRARFFPFGHTPGAMAPPRTSVRAGASAHARSAPLRAAVVSGSEIYGSGRLKRSKSLPEHSKDPYPRRRPGSTIPISSCGRHGSRPSPG